MDADTRVTFILGCQATPAIADTDAGCSQLRRESWAQVITEGKALGCCLRTVGSIKVHSVESVRREERRRREDGVSFVHVDVCTAVCVSLRKNCGLIHGRLGMGPPLGQEMEFVTASKFGGGRLRVAGGQTDRCHICKLQSTKAAVRG